MTNSMKNADRFLGFADTYENARPQMPLYPIHIISKYLNNKPNVVVDLGCGTGLSTVVWQNYCNQVIGIEPSEDMLFVASKKSNKNISFIKAFSDNTGLEDSVADVVICSQSFHWMNPTDTLLEVNRILKDNGIFATVDNDWPPVCNLNAEQAYNNLFQKVNCIEKENKELGEKFIKWDKNKHLFNIINSGYFKYCREIVFVNKESCNANRFIDIALSQGGLQSIIKNKPELIQKDIDEFKNTITSIFKNESFEIDFCYRMRIGVK